MNNDNIAIAAREIAMNMVEAHNTRHAPARARLAKKLQNKKTPIIPSSQTGNQADQEANADKAMAELLAGEEKEKSKKAKKKKNKKASQSAETQPKQEEKQSDQNISNITEASTSQGCTVKEENIQETKFYDSDSLVDNEQDWQVVQNKTNNNNPIEHTHASQNSYIPTLSFLVKDKFLIQEPAIASDRSYHFFQKIIINSQQKAIADARARGNNQEEEALINFDKNRLATRFNFPETAYVTKEFKQNRESNPAFRNFMVIASVTIDFLCENSQHQTIEIPVALKDKEGGIKRYVDADDFEQNDFQLKYAQGDKIINERDNGLDREKYDAIRNRNKRPNPLGTHHHGEQLICFKIGKKELIEEHINDAKKLVDPLMPQGINAIIFNMAGAAFPCLWCEKQILGHMSPTGNFTKYVNKFKKAFKLSDAQNVTTAVTMSSFQGKPTSSASNNIPSINVHYSKKGDHYSAENNLISLKNDSTIHFVPHIFYFHSKHAINRPTKRHIPLEQFTVFGSSTQGRTPENQKKDLTKTIIETAEENKQYLAQASANQ